MAKYFGEFDSDEDICREFGVADLSGARVLVASYDAPPYEGAVYVLFEKGGDLYEVHGSHCSCFGLEYQWEPEKAAPAAILHRATKGDWWSGCGEDVPEVDLRAAVADAVRAHLAQHTN